MKTLISIFSVLSLAICIGCGGSAPAVNTNTEASPVEKPCTKSKAANATKPCCQKAKPVAEKAPCKSAEKGVEKKATTDKPCTKSKTSAPDTDTKTTIE